MITPLFFAFNLIGRQDPPMITHAGFYYGFAAAALAWQVAFFIIASDPLRFRPLMIPSLIEKATYATVAVVLFLQSRVRVPELVLGAVDLVLGISFLTAFLSTASHGQRSVRV